MLAASRGMDARRAAVTDRTRLREPVNHAECTLAFMQELTFVSPGQLEFREKPAPKLESSEQALVKPIAVSRCDLDYVFARGLAPVLGPFAVGHECVAEVV